jgi:hypothetical protein
MDDRSSGGLQAVLQAATPLDGLLNVPKKGYAKGGSYLKPFRLHWSRAGTEENSMPPRVTVKTYMKTHCGPTFLLLTDDHLGIRTAGNDTDDITSGVWILRDDTEAEEFEGVEADLPELLRHRERLLALDLPPVDVPEYGLVEVHPIAALLHIARRLELIPPLN